MNMNTKSELKTKILIYSIVFFSIIIIVLFSYTTFARTINIDTSSFYNQEDPIIIDPINPLEQFNSPTSCSPSPGRIGWRGCWWAFDDGLITAHSDPTNPSFSEWYNYNFNIPFAAKIVEVTVRVDANSSNPINVSQLDVRVSRDFGASWGPTHIISPLPPMIEQTFLIDVTSDFPWIFSDFDNTNFKVEAGCIHENTDGCSLDWIPVNVTFSPA